MFDVIVIGKGMFGAAASRYLSQTGVKVALIGPDEPADPATHTGVFGAHYDEGRITYHMADDSLWAELDHRSLERFPQLEAVSGIDFYTSQGYLYVASKATDEGCFSLWEMLATRFGLTYETLDRQKLRQQFPHLHFAEDCLGLWEKAGGGFFSPRRFIQAMLTLAQRQGLTIIPDRVTDIRTTDHSVTITTETGESYKAQKILLATGAFSSANGLLPRPLALRHKREFVLLADLSPAEANRLKNLPAFVYMVASEQLAELYFLPPIRYPNGRTYLKMGANTLADSYAERVEEVCAWYRSGDSEVMRPAMQAMMQQVVPHLHAEAWPTHRCVITRTAHGRPYIDAVIPDRLYVTIGGNGQGAKAADAIGELAAALILDEVWPEPFERADFQAVYADTPFVWTSPPLLREQRMMDYNR